MCLTGLAAKENILFLFKNVKLLTDKRSPALKMAGFFLSAERLNNLN